MYHLFAQLGQYRIIRPLGRGGMGGVGNMLTILNRHFINVT
jgi:hypothetical protein